MSDQKIKMTMKHNNILTSFWLILTPVLAAVIVSNSKVEELKLFEFEFVATIIGLLLGFGITIYTFILQLMHPIIDKIKKRFSDDEKKKNESLLRIENAEKELKQDLWLMFICLIIVLVVGILSKSVDLKFNYGLHYVCYIPETIFVCIYLFCFKALYDLMQSLFSTGKLTIEFLKADNIV